MPLLVLSSEKTVVLANEAMGRLLDVDVAAISEQSEARRGGALSTTDILQGLTLGQLGVAMLQNGTPMWVAWDQFLDSTREQTLDADDTGSKSMGGGDDGPNSGTTTPTNRAKATNSHKLRRGANSNHHSTKASPSRTTARDVTVDVVISPERDSLPKLTRTADMKTMPEGQILAKMIITVWTMSEEQYYALTFTSLPKGHPETSRLSRRTVQRTATDPPQSPRSVLKSTPSANRPQSSPERHVLSARTTSFPPQGPPSPSSLSSSPSLLQKANLLKDAILDSINMPAYAMWKDESLGMPNKALLNLQSGGAIQDSSNQREFLSRFRMWTDDFKRELSLDEFPIFQLCKNQKSFEGMKIGMKHPTTQARIIFDVGGEPVYDPVTGEFVGGIVVLKDITEYTKRIAAQIRENERQFEYIANMVPPMIWTTTPAGQHDWFSKRWYDYTGLTQEESFGEGWVGAFHEEDLPATAVRWRHSLATGEEYITEYRCLRHDGEWRWMLGRALPFRDEDGKIVKWFGTCTDIHDLVEARETAKQLRDQLLKVIEHAKVTLWAVDRERSLTFLEGTMKWHEKWMKRIGQSQAGTKNNNQVYLGENIYDMFGEEGETPWFKEPVEQILAGKASDETREVHLEDTDRWIRARFVPLTRNERKAGIEGDSFIDGVIGVSMDVTELRKREQDLKKQEKENAKLMANTLAAKEASRMKSQFLANEGFFFTLQT
ncbi:MAG: hypothetical protein M1822_002335 [Bathelium mastoideum]|nr:MAG: hypothetical protein M1822_002335 [Bathelium mastoideum]